MEKTGIIGMDRLVGIAYLMEITGKKRTSVWRLLKSGQVPAPFFLGNTKPLWKKSSLDAWIAGLGGLNG